MGIKIKQESEKEVPTEILAQSIVEISQGVRKLRAGRLNDKALRILLSHTSGLSQKTVAQVLNALEDLEAHYIRKVKP